MRRRRLKRPADFKYRQTSMACDDPHEAALRGERSPDRLVLGRRAAADLVEGSRREWLATTGWGDYALGTTSGVATRRYHGLLVAASRAPIGRRMLVPFIDAEAVVGRRRIALASRRWADGSVEPDGYRQVAGFALEDGIPAWTFELGAARLERRYAMLRDERAIAVIWTLVDAPEPVSIDARVFVEHRGQHQLDPDAEWLPEVAVAPAAESPRGARARIELPANRFAATPTTLHAAVEGGSFAPAASWWRRHLLVKERARGYDAIGSSCHALTATLTLAPGETRALVVGLDASIAGAAPDGAAILAAERARRSSLAANAANGHPSLRALAISGDHFIVRRRRRDGGEGRSIIAGFPLFEDWGRDAMLALPGLLLATGRADEAKSVVSTFLEHLSDGLLPNRFPDEAFEPEYHSADAPLLAIRAALLAWRASGDDAWLAGELPALLSIVDHYARGTRHGIGIAGDGLVAAGAPGLQLTWMDAKIGELVVTPRVGKPIELSALWIAALDGLAGAIDALGPAARPASTTLPDATRLRDLATRGRAAFARYWNADTQSFRDILDGTAARDALDGGEKIRPNQLFALAMMDGLDRDQSRRALARIATYLATPLAVRTLAPSDPAYRGRYEGDQRSRDLAYHNGTAWPFLAGLRLLAELRVDPARGRDLATRMLEDLEGQLRDGGLGSIAEITDGDAPHDPRGCPMQAWSVGCVLEALVAAGVAKPPCAEPPTT